MSEKITFRGVVGEQHKAHYGTFEPVLNDFHMQISEPGVAHVTENLIGCEFDVTLTPVEPRLELCPFCGGEAALFDDRNGARRYQVRCLDCSTGRTLWASVKADAIEAWNRRAP